MTEDRPFGSLRGLRVVEISTSVAGPLVGTILGDLGADVVKIEQVGRGDDTRKWTPPQWAGKSVTFMSLNRNKRSMELDYKHPDGAEILTDLIAEADVFVHNLRPGALKRAGFGWEEMSALNPRLISCEITGFGPTGPKSQDAAYDPLVQAYSGIVSLMAPVDGSPVRVPVSILDRGSAMWAVIGIMDALRRRDISGEGALVETSLLQTAMSWINVQLTGAVAGNEKREALGSGHDGVVPYGAFPVKDGHIFMSAGNQALWLKFLTATDQVELNSLPGFGSNPERSANRALVNARVSEITSRYDAHQLLTLLKSHGVPASMVNAVEDMVDDAQVAVTGMIEPVAHPQIEGFKLINLPITINGEYPAHQRPAPELGASSREVLSEMGLSQEHIERLLAAGVIGVSSEGEAHQ
jgi:crotonobetainyl-CoA:carnitine CoA-transferase CaiB-like acyl-CoA transferase